MCSWCYKGKLVGFAELRKWSEEKMDTVVRLEMDPVLGAATQGTMQRGDGH